MYVYICIYIYTKYTPRVHGQLCFLVSNPFNWGYIYQSNPNIKTKLWDISYIYIYTYIHIPRTKDMSAINPPQLTSRKGPGPSCTLAVEDT